MKPEWNDIVKKAVETIADNNDPPNFRILETCFICKHVDIQGEDKYFCKKYNNRPVYKTSICDDFEIKEG